jgi:hypothetical protein
VLERISSTISAQGATQDVAKLLKKEKIELPGILSGNIEEGKYTLVEELTEIHKKASPQTRKKILDTLQLPSDLILMQSWMSAQDRLKKVLEESLESGTTLGSNK